MSLPFFYAGHLCLALFSINSIPTDETEDIQMHSILPMFKKKQKTDRLGK